MSIISSKQAKQQNLVDVLFVCLALTLIVLVLIPSNWNLYNSIRVAPATFDIAPVDSVSTENFSFAADQRYWDANCSHGWSSDARCDSIVAKAQSCSASVSSGYCSEYTNYLKAYNKK
jgi:hypothetical protein